MGQTVHKVSVLARGDFSVYDSSNAPVTGLVNGDFTKLLSKDGVSDATVVTVTEIATGRYTATFTPASTGIWTLTVRNATHNPRGWGESFNVTTDGVISLASINAEMVDALTVDTITELSSGAPTATPTLAKALMLLYMMARNAGTASTTERKIKNDAGDTITKATMSDDGTTFDQGELGAP
jgi:hypothetical protein